jgi:uncharacterized membrane protein YcaP (DUF421 family)
MGKRQIGQLQPFELVIILMITELVTIPSQDVGVPLLSGLLPVLVLLFVGLCMSQLSLKNHRFRDFVSGLPTLVVNKGVVLEKALRQQRYTLTDLFEQLRAKEVFFVGDIEYAVLETNGELSVVLKTAKRPVTTKDLDLKTTDGALPLALIMDGELQEQNLRSLGLDANWLKKNLKPHGTDRFEDVFIACNNADKTLFVQLKDRKN